MKVIQYFIHALVGKISFIKGNSFNHLPLRLVPDKVFDLSHFSKITELIKENTRMTLMNFQYLSRASKGFSQFNLFLFLSFPNSFHLLTY